MERRKSQRFRGGIYCTFRAGSVFSAKKSPMLFVKDISQRGLSFIYSEPFPFGKKVSVKLYLPIYSKPVKVKAEVRKSESLPDGQYKIGLQFIKIASGVQKSLEPRIYMSRQAIAKAKETAKDSAFQIALVIARYRNGTMVKGITYDFAQNKKIFHIRTLTGEQGRTGKISISKLKAVFFVKHLEGFPEYPAERGFIDKTTGFRVKVEFFDGETLAGISYGYSLEKQGFWLFPSDPKSNNLRIYVVCEALKNVEEIGLFEG